MVSSTNINDYRMLVHPELWKLSEINTNYLKKFITRKRAAGVSLNAINTYVNKLLTWFRELDSGDLLAVTTDDILAVYFARQDRVAAGAYSAATLDTDVIALKQFMQFLHGSKEAGKNIVGITRRSSRNHRLSTEYVTTTQIKQMRDCAESMGDIRGAALIMLTFGTGARISELLDARVCDLDIKQYSAVITVDGKTGVRSIPFVIGMPEIITWLNAHPCRLPNGRVNPDAPLFVTYNTRGYGTRKLSRKRVEAYFTEISRKIGVPPDVRSSPHALRHRMATIMARKLTIREMNLFFGWSDVSTTALTYIHTSQEDLEHSIIAINGITVPDEVTGEQQFVIQCPSCHKILAVGTQVCPQCRLILDPVLAVQFNEVVSDMSRRDVIEKYLSATQ